MEIFYPSKKGNTELPKTEPPQFSLGQISENFCKVRSMSANNMNNSRTNKTMVSPNFLLNINIVGLILITTSTFMALVIYVILQWAVTDTSRDIILTEQKGII